MMQSAADTSGHRTTVQTSKRTAPASAARACSLRLSSASAPTRPEITVAETELARVHAAELSYLLREAARARCTDAPRAESVAWIAREPQRDDVWRAAWLEELEWLARDGVELPGAVNLALAECSAPSRASWPDARALARLALQLDPCEVARLELALACIAHGDARTAADIAREELAAPVAPFDLQRWWCVLASADRALGRVLHSLACYERAAELGGELGWGAAARTLYLALALGDAPRALRAASRVSRASPGVRDAIDAFDARAPARARPGPLSSSERAPVDSRAPTGQRAAFQLERTTRELDRWTSDWRNARRLGVHPTLAQAARTLALEGDPSVQRIAGALE